MMIIIILLCFNVGFVKKLLLTYLDGATMRLYKNGIEVGNKVKIGNIDTNLKQPHTVLHLSA